MNLNNDILIVDNYDSFTYNLLQTVKFAGYNADITTIDKLDKKVINHYHNFILSPGPGLPDENPNLINFIKYYSCDKKILGVCLGLQAIAMTFGGRLNNLSIPRHGKPASLIFNNNDDIIFTDIPDKSTIGLYHSWEVCQPLPDVFLLTALDESGVVMSIRSTRYNLRGVQFHPESIITRCGTKMIKNWIELC